MLSCCFSKLQHNLTFQLRMSEAFNSPQVFLEDQSSDACSYISCRQETGTKCVQDHGKRWLLRLITADVITSSFPDVALKTLYTPHIQHAVSVHSSRSIEFHWKYIRLSLCSALFLFYTASLTGREVTKYSQLCWHLRWEEDIDSLTHADQQVALMLLELFITNTSCLLLLVVVAAAFLFGFFF